MGTERHTRFERSVGSRTDCLQQSKYASQEVWTIMGTEERTLSTQRGQRKGLQSMQLCTNPGKLLFSWSNCVEKEFDCLILISSLRLV